MQHAGLHYGQGAANSHQSPPFALADISQNNGGNTTSSLRQFRKKDGPEKNSGTDLNTQVENSQIARVPPHNHYPARPNDYYRYHPQYPDYNSTYKEAPAPVKYSEIAETPPQPHQHVDHMSLQKHKESHKEFIDMCTITQQTHMKQNYAENLSRQQSYPPDAAPLHQQYIHKDAQVHSDYKTESQYQQYSQMGKYNMPAQCRKYPPPPPPPENDFLAKLQRINPSMARSIMSDHHIRESQTTYPNMEQNRMFAQNQRYYPSPVQNNYNYHTLPQPFNYSSCNYKHAEYPPRTNQMSMGGAQYPNPHPDRSISPRNVHAMNYGTGPQKIPPTYSQYTPPEYAQHYQHRRASMPQEYYQQNCRTNPYMNHQIPSEETDNRASSGLRHFIENWAEEEGPADIAPIFKDNVRPHSENSDQVLVINSSEIPQCLENISLVPTENGQYILKSSTLDNSVVRLKESTENNGDRTVNLQIVEALPKSDCLLDEDAKKLVELEETPVPYQENQTKSCDEEKQPEEKPPQKEVPAQNEQPVNSDDVSAEASVIVCNEVSVIKDMPVIEEDNKKTQSIEDNKKPQSEGDTRQTPAEEDAKPTEEQKEETEEEETLQPMEECETLQQEVNKEPKFEKEILLENYVTSTTKRTQRIFSVDDIINNIGNSANQPRRSSLQITKNFAEDVASEEQPEEILQDKAEPENENAEQEMEFNAISIEDDSIILEIGGALVQLNINYFNGTKVLSVLPLSDSLVIDVNGNYQEPGETELVEEEIPELEAEETCCPQPPVEEDIHATVCQSEIVIGEESMDNEVFIDLNAVQRLNEDPQIEKKPEKVRKKERKPSSDVKKKFKEAVDVKKSKIEEDKRKVVCSKNTEKKILEERAKPKKVIKIDDEGTKKTILKINEDKKETPQLCPENEEMKRKESLEDVSKSKRAEAESRTKDCDKPVSTKAAKKLYVNDPVFKKSVKEHRPSVEEKSKSKVEVKRSLSKLEEAVNKIKLLREKPVMEDYKLKKPSLKEQIDNKSPKMPKKVTFNLATEIREIGKEEVDRKKLSWEEYNSRKRKSSLTNDSEKKIMEDTVTSTKNIDDAVVQQVALSIENAIKDSTVKRSPIKVTTSNWEDDADSPKSDAIFKLNSRKCIIDANEFNIKPIESVSTPSPVSSSQFSYHSEEDSLQVYKDVVDSKLNSLNINIPKVSKPPSVDNFSVLVERFLNKGTLNCSELEVVKKVIEFKRKFKEKQLTYEVRGERNYKDLKLHLKKVPEKRKRKRFRNLYTEDTSEESDSSRSEKGVGDYSVYQRDSQGVPKLIFKRKSGLPQPFVKLERSQEVDLMAKKRKLY